jgi:hypothetical protein
LKEAGCKAFAADIDQSVILANRLLKEFMMSDEESAAEGRNGAPVGDVSVLIRRTQDKVATYLVHARARQRRLLNLAIVAGAVATALTASPALGGKNFADWLDATFGLTSPAWQILCAGAAICSLAAAIATQVLKSNNVDERVTRAENVKARLEVLDAGRMTGQLTPKQVATEYAACVQEASFI